MEIVFTAAMREQVEEVVSKVVNMHDLHITPSPVNDRRCEGCSLKDSCMPGVVAGKQQVKQAAVKLFEIEGDNR